MSTPSRTPPRLLRVKRSLQLTPKMKRITLVGDALAGFPLDADGAHIKLLLARPGQRDPVLPTLGPDGPVWPPEHERPVARTYSVARHDAEAGELDIDFVLHGDEGPASRWAGHAVAGDSVGVAGPGGPARFLAGADWYLLAADPSALAMLASVLAALPADARGAAFIEVPEPEEVQALVHPPGIRVQWLSRDGAPAATSRLLLDAVRALAWPQGVVSASLAGESRQVVALRDHLLNERGLPRHAMYAVPYWKEQYTEEGYHAERHRIMDEDEEEAEAEVRS